MGIDLSKPKQVFFFIFLLSLVSVLLVNIENYLLQPFISNPYYKYIETFGFIGIYTLLFSWFNNSLWKSVLFQWVGLVKVPIIEGRWKGVVISSYKGVTVVPSYLEIEQNFLGVNIFLYTKTSFSRSYMASIIKKNNELYELQYNYDNDPNEKATKTMHSHIGLVRLNYNNDKKILTGYYFNENRHDRGNTGKMNFVFITKKMLGRF